MRVLVTGSRTWRDAAAVHAELDLLYHVHGRLDVIHGACQDRDGNLLGADGFADAWARDRMAAGWAVTVAGYPAPWGPVGNIAGPMRNGLLVGVLLALGGVMGCLAFIENASRGATGCADFAEAMGVPTRRIRSDGRERGGAV